MLERSSASALVALGGLGLVAGSLMTWVTFFGLSMTGPETEGEDWIIALLAGVALIGVGFKNAKHPLDTGARLRSMLAYWGQPVPIWMGPLLLLFGGWVAIANFVEIVQTVGVDSVGIGMWLMVLASGLCLVGLVFGRSKPASEVVKP